MKACLFIPSFNNPLGSCMPDEYKNETGAYWLQNIIVPLIEDDIYGELYFGKSRPKTCKSFDTEGGFSIVLQIFKKAWLQVIELAGAIPGKLWQRLST